MSEQPNLDLSDIEHTSVYPQCMPYLNTMVYAVPCQAEDKNTHHVDNVYLAAVNNDVCPSITNVICNFGQMQMMAEKGELTDHQKSELVGMEKHVNEVIQQMSVMFTHRMNRDVIVEPSSFSLIPIGDKENTADCYTIKCFPFCKSRIEAWHIAMSAVDILKSYESYRKEKSKSDKQ